MHITTNSDIKLGAKIRFLEYTSASKCGPMRIGKVILISVSRATGDIEYFEVISNKTVFRVSPDAITLISNKQ